MTTDEQQSTPAEIRLAQYADRSTWSTATYDSGTEKALHEIALGLKEEIDRLRAELATEQPEFTDDRTAWMQIGMTPALQGLRAELRIEGYPPLVGRYAGAGMRGSKNLPNFVIIEPTLLFEHAEMPAAVETGE